MGNGNIHGEVYLCLDTYSFFPGEQVSGSVYIHLAEGLSNASLLLSVEGDERTSWTETRTVYSRINSRTETYRIVTSGDRKIIDLTTTIHQWSDMIAPKDIKHDFTLTLPPVPGSFRFSHDYKSASIQYYLTAKLMSENSGEILVREFTTPIHINQDPADVSIHNELVQAKSARLKICCFHRGTTGIKAKIPKEFYHANEPLIVLVEIDNSQSLVDLKNIKACLRRKITITSNHAESKTIKDKIISAVIPGIKRGQAMLEQNELSLQLDLASVRDSIGQAGTCYSSLINCSYQLEVWANMKGCFMCCGSKPSVFCSMIIVSNDLSNPPVPPFREKWNPEIYGPVHIGLDQTNRIESSSDIN